MIDVAEDLSQGIVKGAVPPSREHLHKACWFSEKAEKTLRGKKGEMFHVLKPKIPPTPLCWMDPEKGGCWVPRQCAAAPLWPKLELQPSPWNVSPVATWGLFFLLWYLLSLMAPPRIRALCTQYGAALSGIKWVPPWRAIERPLPQTLGGLALTLDIQPEPHLKWQPLQAAQKDRLTSRCQIPQAGHPTDLPEESCWEQRLKDLGVSPWR